MFEFLHLSLSYISSILLNSLILINQTTVLFTRECSGTCFFLQDRQQLYTTIFCSFPLPVLSSSAAKSSGSSSMNCKKEYIDYATFDIQIFLGCLSISLMNTLHFPQHFSGVKKKTEKKPKCCFFFNEHLPGPLGGDRDAEVAQVPSDGL